MIKAAVIGATGYAGAELVRLLQLHSEAEIGWMISGSSAGREYRQVHPQFTDIVSAPCTSEEMKDLAEEADVIFTATPQGFCGSVLTPDILSRTKVIDLSADYRILDADVYEAWYGIEHQSKALIPEAAYGLCEIHREQIKKSALIANPGCYTTCSILALYPMVKAGLIENSSIIIDAKSGTSGAGRSGKLGTSFCEVNENVKAYGVANHRHTPEIEEQLSLAAEDQIRVSFTPHLIPMSRGILVTAYGTLRPGVTAGEVHRAYRSCYADEHFIRLLDNGRPPETRFVRGSNYVDISYVVDERTNRVVMMGALDNLMKGAAGQAIQNMNLLFGLPEMQGLEAIPMCP